MTIMKRASRNLFDIIVRERWAGRDLKKVIHSFERRKRKRIQKK